MLSVDRQSCSTDQEAQRKALFKVKNSFRSQEEKRRKFLEEQKRKRNAVFSESRDLSEVSEKIQEDVQLLEQLSKKKYGKMLMLSEWMEEVPQDLEEKWLCVPCPVGKRCIVISEKNFCHAYALSGKHLFKSRALLREGRVGRTILDCIYSRSTNTIFILDVLVWADYSLINCETEFRFYWLKSKFDEDPSLTEGMEVDGLKFVPLTNAPASETENLLASTNFPVKLDGVLFFHKEAHYSAGVCPLVAWLLPFMVPEVLGVSVSDELAERPENYAGHIEYIANYDNMRKEILKQRASVRAARRSSSKMDTSGSCQDSSFDDINREMYEEEELELG